MPVDVDERGSSAARRLLDSVSSADTAAALAMVRSTTGVTPARDAPARHGWMMVAAAAVVLVVIGVATWRVRWSDSVATVDSEPSTERVSTGPTTPTVPSTTDPNVPSTAGPAVTTEQPAVVPTLRLDGLWRAGSDVVWALVDGRILRSVDGGESWRDVGEPAGSVVGRAVFVDDLTGWITGDHGVQVTRDGGGTWQRVDVLPAGSDADAVTGLATFAGRVYTTLWSGPTVTIWSSPVDQDEWTSTPTDVSIGAGQAPTGEFAFSDSARFLVHNNQGQVGSLRSIGGDWIEWPIGCNGGRASVVTSGVAGDVVVICYPGRSEPRDSPIDGSPLAEGSTFMFVSADDGESFTAVNPPPVLVPDEFGRVQYSVLAHPDPDTFVVVATPNDRNLPVFITRDRGGNWFPLTSPSAHPVRSLLTSGRSWILVADRPTTGDSELWVSQDAGETWTLTLPTPSPPTISEPEPVVSADLTVSYLTPPPRYEPDVFAQIDPTTESVVVGDGFLVGGVRGDPNTTDDDHLIVLDLATNTTTTLEIEQLPHGMIAGPGPVVYGEIFTTNPDQTAPGQRFVAIALAGDRAGQTILDVPALGHPVDALDDDFFDHDINGVVDTWNGDVVMSGYLDPAGQRLTPERTNWPRVRFDYDTDVVNQLDGPTWPLAIEPHPDASSSAISHVGVGAAGTAVYATWFGPGFGDDLDYLTPTGPIIAALMPNATGAWYQLPEGWWVADSNVWGTLLASHDGGAVQLAWFDPTTTP